MIEVPHLAGMERNTLAGWPSIFTVTRSSAIFWIVPISRFATPRSRDGAVNWIRSPFGKVPADLLIGRDTLEAFRVVGYLVALIEAHGEAIGFGVDCGDGGIGAFSIPCSLLPFE